MLFKRTPPQIEHQTSIQLGQTEFEIDVKFINKKNSNVSIQNTQINFRLSSKLSSKQAQNHYEELLQKIIIKIQNSPHSIQKTFDFKKIYKNGKFQFHNQIYYLNKSSKTGIKFENENTIRINQNLKLEQIEKKLEQLLIKKFEPMLQEHLEKLNEFTYKYDITGFHTANLKSRWGHCTHDNKIMLNIKLLNTDVDVLNYVIFHEISHIKVKNHSDRFWKEVERFCPNHKQLRKRLKNNPPQMFVEI